MGNCRNGVSLYNTLMNCFEDRRENCLSECRAFGEHAGAMFAGFVDTQEKPVAV